MRRKRIAFAVQLCILFIVCVLSATVGIALRRSSGSVGNTGRRTVVPQSDEKVIERQAYSKEPFKVSDLRVKKATIWPGQKFSSLALSDNGGGKVEDWLENLSFTIKNTSDKQITYIDYILEFTETGIGRPMMQYVLDKGVRPTASEDVRKFVTPLALNPGDSFTFELSAGRLQMIQKFLEQGGYLLANLNKVNIRIDTVFFADGMKWSHGDLYKLAPGEQPGPGRPANYERVNQ
jgi:hypothetical protein